jgi:hypothetical protein
LNKDRLERANKKKERKFKTKKFIKTLEKRLFKACWALLSEIVRRKAKGKCYTCGKVNPRQETHAGHRWHHKLSLDLRHIHCQCAYCNTYQHGNLGAYERHLIEDHGIEWVKNLEKEAWAKGDNYTLEELKEIKINLENELKSL